MYKMRDDIEFNIRFVKLIEKERCIYDKAIPEYRSKDAQDKAWNKIGIEINESGMSYFQYYSL